MEYAQNTLNHLLANREDVRQKVEVSGQWVRAAHPGCGVWKDLLESSVWGMI